MPIDAEKTILGLPAVKACRIFYQDNDIDQIYVSAQLPEGDSGKRLQEIKSLVRSIVGALALEHNWQVDYRKIKIVDSTDSAFDDEQDVQGGQCSNRIRILAAYIRYSPEPKIVVELGRNGSTYAGHAPYDEADPTGSAIAAFIDAFHLMNLGKITPVFARELAESLSHSHLVILKLRLVTGDNRDTELLGIAESRQDLILCTVRACLSAINRKVGLSGQ